MVHHFDLVNQLVDIVNRRRGRGDRRFLFAGPYPGTLDELHVPFVQVSKVMLERSDVGFETRNVSDLVMRDQENDGETDGRSREKKKESDRDGE
jgi:hypothetical protein